MSEITCRGSMKLGTGCGKCRRCAEYLEKHNLVDKDFLAKRVLMPRKLSVENGAKGRYIGEFYESINVGCHICDGSGFTPTYGGEDFEQCEECEGEGELVQKVYVSWTTLKDFYKRVVRDYGVEASK